LPVALFGGFFIALERLALSGHEWRYGGRLLYAEESPLQRIVLVERNGSVDLFIDGELQFRSADERLYHEALVAPSLPLLPERARVLVMGGGDGLAARDLLQSPRVASVTIVDWDRAVTQLFRRERGLSALNQGSLDDPRVVTLHRDVRALFREPGEPFDLVVGDLVDPSAPGSEQAGLYSSAFYRTVQTRIAPGGVLVTHASSDEDKFLRGVCDALAAASFSDVETYCREIPSFGSVCYVLARR
jgi:spermidine synthase